MISTSATYFAASSVKRFSSVAVMEKLPAASTPTAVRLGGRVDLFIVGGAEPGSADHDMAARGDGRQRIGLHRVGLGVVDQHVGGDGERLGDAGEHRHAVKRYRPCASPRSVPAAPRATAATSWRSSVAAMAGTKARADPPGGACKDDADRHGGGSS